MIEIKLSVEEYNRLYRKRKDGADCYYNLVFCVQENNKICFKTSENEDENIDYVLVEIDLNTTEGRILSKFLGCAFVVYQNEDFNSEYFRKSLLFDMECFWCEKKVKCSKWDDVNRLLKEVIFIDPVPYRTEDNLYVLEGLRNRIKDTLSDDMFKCTEKNIAKINRTMEILYSQLHSLIKQWNYTEESANSNG